VNSVVLFPLKHNNEILGYLWALNFKTEDTVKIKETLELSTNFIASEIANYKLMKQLEFLSSIDLLTGCKNRNAMNNAVDDIVSGIIKISEPYAVVFADLNGLKRINDEKGHGAGDRLLRTASAMLSQVFYGSDVYRAGGDEFMIIVPGLTEDEFKVRLQQLNEKSVIDSDLHFAVGCCFVSHGEDIRTAMRLADERMYEDKKEYYDRYPEKKYR
jgi:diguanylate cyclase (GGDEF)-like protein